MRRASHGGPRTPDAAPHFVVTRDQNSTVAVLDQTFDDYDTVGIRVATRFDVGLLQPKAVTLLTVA